MIIDTGPVLRSSYQWHIYKSKLATSQTDPFSPSAGYTLAANKARAHAQKA